MQDLRLIIIVIVLFAGCISYQFVFVFFNSLF